MNENLENSPDKNQNSFPNKDNKIETSSQSFDYNKLNKSYDELRKSHPYLKADREAEEYINNLRDIGEYNRWSLKLSQQWLVSFYASKILKVSKHT